MVERRPQPGERYRHFKGELYQIVTVAVHSETQEELVIYQALYGDFKVYARPLSLFLSKVDQNKYPNVQQRYRFEKVERTAEAIHVSRFEDTKQTETNFCSEKEQIRKGIAFQEAEQTAEEIRFEEKKTEHITESVPKTGGFISEDTGKEIESGSALPDRTKVLIDFLDCDSYEEKLEYLRDKKKYIDDRMLDDISFALDIVIEDGELEDRIRTLENCLKTFRRYEGTRLR